MLSVGRRADSWRNWSANMNPVPVLKLCVCVCEGTADKVAITHKSITIPNSVLPKTPLPPQGIILTEAAPMPLLNLTVQD